MHSVPRKLTLGLILSAAAIVACGDDVTVEENPPAPLPDPVVRSVVVSPSSATVTAGNGFTFGAAVDADAGLARTVTWSVSGGTGISVDQNGVASTTAAATGVASVCAASTVEPTVKGCAQLTVNPPAPPATVAINRITIGCDAIALAIAPAPVGCNLNSPVSTNNVFGEFQVVVDITRPAGAAVNGVTLEVRNGAVVEHTQTRTISSDFVSASDELGAQVGSQQVTFSVQSAAYTKSATAATPRHVNGQKTIRVFLVGGATNSTADRDLTFRNPNGFHIELATSLTGNNANGVAIRQNAANATSWVGGTGLVFNVFPVSYTGVAANTATIVTNFGIGCDQNLGITRTVTNTVVGGVSVGTFAYTNGSGGATGNVNAYEFAPGCTAFGEIPFGNAVDANGNPFINFAIGGPNFTGFNTLNNPFAPVEPTLATAPALRLDNRGPPAPTITNTPGGRLMWFNDAVVLNAVGGTNGAITASPGDLGIGGTVTRSAFVGTAASCGTNALCQTNNPTPATSVVGRAETVTNVIDAFTVAAFDLFLNRTFAGNGPLAIGVDRTAPAHAPAVAPADALVMDAAAGTISVTFSDVLSGFTAAGAVSEALISVVGTVGGLSRANVIGSGSISATPFATAGTAAAPTTTFVNTPAAAVYVPAPTVITTTAIAIPAGPAYYIYQARAVDRALNTSTMFVRRVYVNAGDIPQITGLNSALTYTGGAAALFPATGAAAVEVTSGELRLAYPNLGGAGDLIYSRPTPLVDATFDDNMPIPASVPFSVSAFIRGIQGVTGAGAPDVATFAAVRPTAARGRTYNPFGHGLGLFTAGNPTPVTAGVSGVSADFTAPILAAQITGNTDYSALAAPVAIGSWLTSTSATVPAATCAAVSGGLRTCTFTVTARGPTGTFVNPFTSLAIAESFDAAGPTGDWRLISGPGAVSLGAAASGSPNGVTVTVTPCTAAPFPCLDNGVNRDFTWTVSITRQSAAAVAPNTAIKWYRVIGLNAGFDGLATIPLSINFVTGAIAP